MSRLPDWFSPVPSELTSARMSLHFGLRGDDLFFRRLLVPEAAGAWFVRQLSWAVGALALLPELEKELGRAPNRLHVAHSLEALGSKLEWWYRSQDDAVPWRRRVLGRRAFERDTEEAWWSFQHLSRAEYYVQTTRRQSTVRPMSTDKGLGFAVGTRYAHMTPTARGRELAEAWLSQSVERGRLGRKLVGWIAGSSEPDPKSFVHKEAACLVLGPSTPSEREQQVVARTLFEGEGKGPDTRRALARIFEDSAEFPDVDTSILPALRAEGRAQQAREIQAARAFGAMLDSLIDLAVAARDPVGAKLQRTPIAELAGARDVVSAFESVRARADAYRQAMALAELRSDGADGLAEQLVSRRPAEGVLLVLARAPRVYDVVDRSVGPGDLFRRLQELAHEGTRSDEAPIGEEPELGDRTFSLEGFHELVRDCLPFGVGRA